MKKSLCVMIAIIALIIFSGCSKNELNYTVTEDNGIKTFRNKNIPADPNFKINLSKVAEINFSDVEVEGEKQGIVIENVKLDKYVYCPQLIE